MDWDFIGPLLLLAIIYGLPELFRKRRKGQQQEYPEPEIQVVLPPPVNQSLVYETKIPPISIDKNQQDVGDIVVQDNTTKTGICPVLTTQMTISQRTIINGLIFSEILQQPKAFRPHITGGRYFRCGYNSK